MPLREPGGRVAGMVSVEANCPLAIGQSFDWAPAAEQLQLISDVATPFLVLGSQPEPRPLELLANV